MNDNFIGAVHDSIDILNEQYNQTYLCMTNKKGMQQMVIDNFKVISKISDLLTNQIILLNPDSDEWNCYIDIQTDLTRARGLTVLELNLISNDYQEDIVIRVKKDIGDLLDKLLTRI